MRRGGLVVTIAVVAALGAWAHADFLVDEQAHDLDVLPPVPAPFKIGFFAREPAISHPSALAFDAKGRLFVGGGPQFRRPTPQTPPDSVLLVQDTTGDGVADKVHTFATGFNSIQGLVWRGRDLYVANAPDLTLVRDLNGDDVADEYIRLYEGLGHNRHGLHGLVIGPDGWLYMTQGNSRVQAHAPKAFRDLMGVKSKAPAQQRPKRFTPKTYQHSFIGEWPEAEGGVLRAQPLGEKLEIFARGMRNPFDMDFDADFAWLATDNDDGPEHDRFITPFEGAHFGKQHPWYGSWTGDESPATVPMTGLFPNPNGSGVGVAFYTAPQWPEAYRNTFLVGDWIRKSIYTINPKTEGAHRRGEPVEIFHARGSLALFRPTDIAVGPDGALYIAGWGSHYGSKHAPYQSGDDTAEINEGRVLRMWNAQAPLLPQAEDHHRHPVTNWPLPALFADLGHFVPARSVNAQEELIRRGPAVIPQLQEQLQAGAAPMKRLWLLWTLGRMPKGGSVGAFVNRWFANLAQDESAQAAARLQAMNILQARKAPQSRPVAEALLSHQQARLRFAATQTLRFGRTPRLQIVLMALATEEDRLVRYNLWKTLAERFASRLAGLLRHPEAGVRQAALLALLERDAVKAPMAHKLAASGDGAVADLARQWLEKTEIPETATVAVSTPQTLLARETTMEDVLPLLYRGNSARGKDLFFRPGGPGCGLCHRVGGQGEAMGPDLSDLKARAAPAYIAESILDPNAKIIEGFMQVLLTTKDGTQYAGMVREDTAKLLRLYQADGSTAVIAKSDIRQREVLDVSAMPSGYGSFLSPRDVADLIAWLMAP